MEIPSPDGPVDYSGMTVNERLFGAGRLAEFDAAARARDRARMLEILRAVEVQNADQTVDSILRAPEQYGF
jgi:hypothetical protein